MIAGPPPVQSDNLDKYTDKIRQQFAKAFLCRRGTTKLLHHAPEGIVSGKTTQNQH